MRLALHQARLALNPNTLKDCFKEVACGYRPNWLSSDKRCPSGMLAKGFELGIVEQNTLKLLSMSCSCVFVKDGVAVAEGSNMTNATRNVSLPTKLQCFSTVQA